MQSNAPQKCIIRTIALMPLCRQCCQFLRPGP